MEPGKTAEGSLELILEAEKKAETTRSSAVEAAKDLVAEASEKNKKRVADGIAAAEAEKREKLEAFRREADRMIENELKSARADADRVAQRSAKHMSDAVRAICWKMVGEP